MPEPRPQWSSQTKLVVSLLLLAAFLVFLYSFRIAIPPLILAVILAYILSPLVNSLQNRFGVHRAVATALVYLGVALILVLVVGVIVPFLAPRFRDLNLDYQRVLDQVDLLLSNEIVLPGGFILVGGDLIADLAVALRGVLEPFFGRTLSLVVEAITSLIWVIFILVVSFYLIKDGPRLSRWMEGIVPPAYHQDYVRLRAELRTIWAAFFRGQLVLAFVVAVIFILVGYGIGLPFAFAMGILAGLLEFLPSLGHGIWLVIATILALFLGSTWMPVPNWVFALIVVGLHIIFQQFDLNYLIPRIIGRRVYLPPLVVILGIVAGAAIAGVLGIFLAAPTIASARVLGRYIFANLFDSEPFPEDPAPPLPPPDPHWWRLGRRRKSSG